ncbi:transposase family protein [Crenothrix sp.]|uniref:transposase family protein n=1 Tax=Crenothrix sp. TaxID=3100433 RepID=UPI00374D7A57
MLLQIPLDIPDVTIVRIYTPTKKGFVITVDSKQKGTICQHCGKFIDQSYGQGKEITLRHLPILEKPVWIKIKPKRYQCPYCDNGPTTTQECGWYIPKSPHTKAFEQL